MSKIINWRKFDPKNPEHVKRVLAKLTEFCQAPRVSGERFRAKVAELTTAGDTAAWASALNAIEAFQTDVATIDQGWRPAFDEVDLRDSSKSSFDILDVSSGLTFAQVRDGGRALIYAVAGAKTTVSFGLYGGGLGFLRTWWMDQEWYKVDEAVADFRYKYAKQEATVHYALLFNGGETIAYDTAGATAVIKDINTINAACADLIVDSHEVLPGISDMTQFLFYHHPTFKSRVRQALAAVLTDTSMRLNSYNVTPISTVHASTAYLGKLVAPRLKNKYGRRMDLTLLSDEDITMFAESVVGWGRYGSYVNTAQVRTVAKA